MTKRHRLIQTESFRERLRAFAEQARKEAMSLPPGLEQEGLLRKARQADTAAHVDDWINSPGLQQPK